MRDVHVWFGVAGDDREPLYRKDVIEYDDVLPDEETHGGVHGWKVTSHGDSLTTAFLMVYGPDKDAVERRWRRISEVLLNSLEYMWTDDE